jgi:hypothetical protein
MSTYQVDNQSDSISKIKGGYGGSDDTRPSFNRPKYVKYNTFAKARDLGEVDNLKVTLSGSIGSEAGANTHYYKVKCTASSDLRVYLNSTAKHTDKYISVGLLDQNRKAVQRNTGGFGYRNEIINTEIKESLITLPAGDYYFTVSGSQWQSLPYSIEVQVIRYLLLTGTISGAMEPYGRLPLSKLFGTIVGTDATTGSIPTSNLIKVLGLSDPATASGTSLPYATLAGLFGATTGTMSTTGRMKITWRISGDITGSGSTSGTLSSTGGGYG